MLDVESLAQIRRARSEERETLAAIAWDAKASWGYRAPTLESWREALTPTAGSLRTQPTYVADVHGRVAGFYQIDMKAQPVELGHLWVRPEFMRRGIGRALLEHAARYLAGVRVATLHIDSEPGAEPFYISCGALRVGERAAPIEGRPNRVRPQLCLSTTRPERAEPSR
ncbi:MAG: GNAT family N-acetyltransferase [Burkholderiaceae bacterium]|nr:GNAT family N-acetyltransferase [Burkholderiaceae bacterium]